MTQRPLLFSLILLALTSVLYAQVFHPQYEEFIIKQEHVSTLDGIFERGESLIQTRDELQEVYRSIPSQQITIVDELISEYTITNIILFLLELNQLVQRSPVPSDSGYLLGQETDDGETVVVPITFTFADLNYQSFLTFLGNLENWNKAIRITSVKVGQPSTNPGQSDRVTVTVQIEAIFFQTLLKNAV